jgi:Lipocalin-like domain
MLAKRVVMPLIAVSLVVVAVVQAQQRTTPSLVGVWKIAEVTTTGPDGRRLTPSQPGLQIFTARHFSLAAVTADKPRPDLPSDKSTDKQLADAFGPFVARAGTYEVKGNEIIYHPIVAKSPNMMKPGVVLTDTFKFEGNDTVVLVNKSGPTGPVANPATLKLTRLE